MHLDLWGHKGAGLDNFIDQLEGAGSLSVTGIKEGEEGGSEPGFRVEWSSERGKASHVENLTETVGQNGEVAWEDNVSKTKQEYFNGLNLDKLKTTGQQKPKKEEYIANNKEGHKAFPKTKIKQEAWSEKPESEASLNISKCLDSFEQYQLSMLQL